MGGKCAHLGFKPGKGRKNGSEMRDAGANDGHRVAAGIKRTGAEQELRTGNVIGRE